MELLEKTEEANSLQSSILSLCKRLSQKEGVFKTSDEDSFDNALEQPNHYSELIREDERRIMYANAQTHITFELFKVMTDDYLLVTDERKGVEMLQGIRDAKQVDNGWKILLRPDDLRIYFSQANFHSKLWERLGGSIMKEKTSFLLVDDRGFIVVDSNIDEQGAPSRDGVSWMESSSDSDMEIIAQSLKEML